MVLLQILFVISIFYRVWMVSSGTYGFWGIGSGVVCWSGSVLFLIGVGIFMSVLDMEKVSGGAKSQELL